MAEHIRKVLGDEKYEWLLLDHQRLQKISRADERDIATHYRLQHRAMLERRADGFTGWLDFENWQQCN